MLIDRDKVIKGLEICFNVKAKCTECPYDDIEIFPDCTEALEKDTINLLKEQEQTIENLNDIIAIHEER